MNFEIVGDPIKMRDHFVDGKGSQALCDILNKDYIGWVFIKNADQSMNGIYHVYAYQYRGEIRDNIDMLFDIEFAGGTPKLDKLSNLNTQNHVSHFQALITDSIYKLEEIKDWDDEEPPKIKWYSKGKLVKFEQFNN